MEEYLKKGYGFIKDNLIEYEKPDLESDPLGVLEKGEVIDYENMEKKESGIWISYTKDDVKRYILAIDNEGNLFINLPKIKDGNYILKPFKENENANKLNFFNNNLLLQFVPEDNSYKIIYVENSNSLGVNEENIIEECEVFSENEIKWNIKRNKLNEFNFEDSKTGLRMEFCENLNKLILSEINNDSYYQKFKLIPIQDYNENNKEDKLINEDKNDENGKIDILNKNFDDYQQNNNNNDDNNDLDKNIENDNNDNNINLNQNKNNNKINFNENGELSDEEEEIKEEEEEEKEIIKEINLNVNPEIKAILEGKNNNETLKFLAPKFIITEEDIIDIQNKDSIKHIEIDLSIEEIEDNIFNNFKNIESVYCNPKWLNKFNQRNLKEVYIKEGITSIEKNLFELCFKLNIIYLPYSILKIEENSFENCLEIKKIFAEYKWYKIFDIEAFQVPNNITVLKREIFHNWKHLKLIIIPPTVNEIEEGCFENCIRLEEIDIPEGVKIIPRNCFRNCLNLRSIQIPNSVQSIHGTAFIGCINLENIYANNNISKLFVKTLQIPEDKKLILNNDYNEYKNIETLEIPLNTEVDINFFKNFPYLRVVNFEPLFLNFIDKTKINAMKIPEGVKEIPPNTFKEMYCLEYLDIPDSMEKIEKDEFSDCVNIVSVKCQSKFINYFNKNNLISIILSYDELDINSDPFKECKNLESATLPDYYELFEEYLFRNCRKLNIIKYLSGKEKKFKTIYEVPSNIKNIKYKDYIEWTNVDTLIVNENVQNIEEYFLENCTDLQVVQMDPKFLKCIPKSEIICVIVPNFVKNVNETDFEGCEKLKKVIFLGETDLEGNSCKEFENITKLECDPYILLHAKKNLRDNISNINILDGSVFLYDECLKDFTQLENIRFPNSLNYIGERCFSGCTKLEELYIPYTIKEIPRNAFENCPKLTSIKCISRFLDCLPKEQISNLIILNNMKELEDVSFGEFKNLKKIEFVDTIEIVPSNNFRDCPKLTEIICSDSLLKSLEPEDKENFQNIKLNEIKENEISEELLKDCVNLENINIPYNKKIKPLEKKEHATTVEEIMNKDPDNLKYKYYLETILKDIKSGNHSLIGPQQSLGEIAQCITQVCIKIKDYTNLKSGGKKVMIPHPVQVITILRICDEILSGRGAIAQVKTGEGKSFIISVIAIVLAMHGRLIDVVTSNLELAIRDEKDQRDYYKLFNIKSGVLCRKDGDKDFLNLMKSQIIVKDDENNDDSDYNTDVFEKEIVYSTNYNFEFAYLHSLFSDKPLRNRPYDVVIVDEVDNMFLDQSSSPAIIAYGISILYHKDILSIIYLLKDNDVETIIKVLKYYFPEGIEFDKSEISKLKKSAISAEKHEINVDYIKENDQVIIVDRTTGYKKPGSRWQNCIHEFVEIKEGVEVKSPTISTCSITQCTFFNMYKSITGLSGTLGGDADEKILKSAYKINLFRVPRNLPSKVPIRKRERPEDPFDLYNLIAEEILEVTQQKRPVLVIFDTIRQVEEFLICERDNFDKNKLGTIQGIIPQNDREVIQSAGISSKITIATAAAGRGMDIKLDKTSLENGGLHVIIPYSMKNERVFWQCVGRCGRQGQPGSCTEYISDDDYYYKTRDFDPKFENLLKLQNKFSDYLKNNWKWLFLFPKCASVKVDYTFNISIEKMLVLTTKCIPSLDERDKAYSQKLTSYYLDMIMKAWGLFYSRVEENLEKYDSYNQMEDDYEKNFMQKLNVWIPKNCNSVHEAHSSIENEKFKRIDWLQLLMDGLQVVEFVVTICFPEIAPLVVIANLALQGGVRIYKKLKAHEKIDWFQEFLEIGIDGALSLTKLKVFQKGGKFRKLIGKTIKNKKLLEVGKFINNINKHFDQNKGGRMIKFLGKGFGKDILKRREEYKSAVTDIIQDLAIGKVPKEKISKLIIDGVYNGCSSTTIDYVNKVMGEKKTLKKKLIEGSINTVSSFLKGVTNDVVNNKDFMTSIKHNSYKSLTNPFKKWVNEKVKTNDEKFNEIQSFILDGVEKTVDDLVLDIIDNKKNLFNERGEFNHELLNDFINDLKMNEQDASKKYIEKKFFEKLNKRLLKEKNEK